MRIFSESITTGIDANTNALSAELDIRDNLNVSFGVVGTAGTHNTHITTLQCSLDNTNWEDTAHTLTGTGIKDGIQIVARYVRVEVSTAEGGTSTITIIIQAK